MFRYSVRSLLRDRVLTICSVLAMGGSIYLFTIEGLFGSTNHGELWTPVNIDIPSSLVIAAFPAVVDDRIYLQAFELPGDGSQKAHTYTFDGESWEDAGSSMPPASH